MSKTLPLSLFLVALFHFTGTAHANYGRGPLIGEQPGISRHGYPGRPGYPGYPGNPGYPGYGDDDRSGGRFNWIGSRCGEFTPSGVLIRYAEEYRCPRTNFNWIGSRCGEFTPAGVLIRYSEEYRCPRTYFNWIGSRCGEFTPAGVLIRYAEEYRCPR